VVSAVIFDLGGNLVDWPDFGEALERWWGLSYDHLNSALPSVGLPAREEYVGAMIAALPTRLGEVRSL
jgi:putative hydrolase of the HAD superfamily